MIYLNNKEKLNRIKLTPDNYYVVTDFDQTITNGFTKGSWGVDINANEEYEKERAKLYNYYRPIEIDSTMDKNEKTKHMKNWYTESLNILIKYNLTEKEIIKTVESNKFILRDYAKTFFKKLYNDKVPILMLSAGIGNVIIKILEYNEIYFDNIYIDSNFLIFKDEKIVGISDNIIHTMNKNSEGLLKKFGDKVKDRENILLFGDTLSDINMIRKEDLDKSITVRISRCKNQGKFRIL